MTAVISRALGAISRVTAGRAQKGTSPSQNLIGTLLTTRATTTATGRGRRPLRWPLLAAALALAGAFLAVPALAGVPARLIEGCATWIVLATILELLSVLGFVVVFKLVFGSRMSWRRCSPAGLRALAATTILPAGGIVGPAAGAQSAGASLEGLSRATIGFVVLTNVPGMVVLAVLGLILWLGGPGATHELSLTLVPAALAATVLAGAWRVRRSPAPRRSPGVHPVRPLAVLRDGIADARGLVVARNWKLLGALGYYAFDNAVLWAAFHAYGRTPALGVIAMGYLIGSLATALPTPAGLGAAEGGLIGALVLYGAPAAHAAAAVLLYRGITLSVPVLLGGVACADRAVPGLRSPLVWVRARRPSNPCDDNLRKESLFPGS